MKTGDDIVINTDEISADKMTAQQLAHIGRGAIGGYREDELRRDSGDDENSATAAAESSSSSEGREPAFVGLLNARTERDLEKAEGFGGEFDEKRGEYEADESRESNADKRRRTARIWTASRTGRERRGFEPGSRLSRRQLRRDAQVPRKDARQT